MLRLLLLHRRVQRLLPLHRIVQWRAKGGGGGGWGGGGGGGGGLSNLQRFKEHHPSTFTGGGDPMIADHWFRKVEKIL